MVNAALLLCGLALQQTGGQVFRSGVQTVFVDVSVLSGRTLRVGLAPADFTLTDNGAAQRIDDVGGVQIPLDATLIVDASSLRLSATPFFGADELHHDSRQVAELLDAADRFGVITFASRVDVARAMAPLDASRVEIPWTNSSMDLISDRYAVTEAVMLALTRPSPPDRRHVIVLFAHPSGEPTVSPLEHLVPAARRADALLYVVLAPTRVDEHRQPYPVRPREAALRDALTKAAEASGGKAYLTGDIIGALREVVKEFRSSYVLRYTVQGVETGGWHDIVVKVPSCPTCTIHARRGYIGQ